MHVWTDGDFDVELLNCSSWFALSSESFHLSSYKDQHFKTNWLLESSVTSLRLVYLLLEMSVQYFCF